MVDVLEMPKPPAIFAVQLFRRGAEYLDAFEDLAGEGKPPRHFAGYFLYAHALELLLKSFLAAKGVQRRTLMSRKTYGHDLVAIYQGCEAHDIPTVQNLSAFVHHFKEMNTDHDLRYPSDYKLTFPRPHECLEVARALVNAIGPTVNAEGIKAEVHFASSTRHLRGKAKIRWADDSHARERRSHRKCRGR